MNELIHLIINELFKVYISFSCGLYDNFSGRLNIVPIVVLVLFSIYWYVIIHSIFKKKIIWNSVYTAILIVILTVSITIGYKIDYMDKIGYKIVNKISLDEKSGINIPVNLDKLDTIYFSKRELEIIKTSFTYQYYNKDTINRSFNLNHEKDFYELFYKYYPSVFKIIKRYKSSTNRFVFSS
ncbi:MAG: hypothetical protein ACOYN6_13980 [Ignavibacteria bacterium]